MEAQRPRERDAIERGSSPPAAGGKRRYSPPRLTCWGDVRDLTLGGTVGQLDSGNPAVEQPP